MEGSEPRPHAVNRLLDHLFDYFIQDYVEGWYERMCPGDPDISRVIKSSFWVRFIALNVNTNPYLSTLNDRLKCT